jgi:K+-transporting ATPase ATPase A chain
VAEVTIAGVIQIVVLACLLTGTTALLGGYMAKVYQGERVALSGMVAPIERLG